jgi:hypothetical protein
MCLRERERERERERKREMQIEKHLQAPRYRLRSEEKMYRKCGVRQQPNCHDKKK